jgi:hypothetical protein
VLLDERLRVVLACDQRDGAAHHGFGHAGLFGARVEAPALGGAAEEVGDKAHAP